MAFPTFDLRQLMEAGVHFGHQTRRWNPAMAPYIYGVRNGVHIIDLTRTVPMLHRALVAIRDTVAQGGRVLFVGTKRQAQEAVAEAARRCGQYYVNHRWLGGTLTNWRTIGQSIRKLRDLEALLADPKKTEGLTKKELLHLERRRQKLERALGGIKDMGGLPDILFVIDVVREAIAVAEARKLGIPIVAICDTNADPRPITYPVPGNDDATRAIQLYCDLVARAVIDGIQAELAASGADVGALEELPAEELPAEELPAAQPPAEEVASAGESGAPAGAGETAAAGEEEGAAEQAAR